MDWATFRNRDFSSSQFNRATVAVVALGFLTLLLAGAGTAWLMKRTQDHNFWVAHTYQLEGVVADLRLDLEQAEAARRGYFLSGDASLRARFFERTAQLDGIVRRFGRLSADNPRQQQRIPLLRRTIGDLVAAQRATLAHGFPKQAALVNLSITDPSSLRARVESIAMAMLDEEHRLLALRNDDLRRSVRQFFALLGVTGLLMLLVAALSIGVIFRYTRDLTRSRNALSDLNATLETAVDERTADLSRANAEIQRFAYIVSHDLRSPLVNVMGFTAELEGAASAVGRLIDRAEAEAPQVVDAEARVAAREDLPEAIGFIRSSTQKMDRLINAILQLSRQGRRVLSPERLDMTALAGGVRDTLAHRADTVGANIVIEALPPIVSDRLGLEQMLQNLVENALKYLQPGRPGHITIGGQRRGNRVCYSVTDNGRGVDPRDHQRIFDLFRRSGVQDQPGEGIGLAHVRALAYRLGGTIDCVSRLGEGATFTLTLPATFAGEAGSAE